MKSMEKEKLKIEIKPKEKKSSNLIQNKDTKKTITKSPNNKFKIIGRFKIYSNYDNDIK